MLREKFKNYQIILGSQSPRRKELLKGLDLDFKVVPLHADESYSVMVSGADITEYLCQVKADAYQNWQENEILITSDTIVWKDNHALEKPKNKEEARQMLSNLQNASHTVYTSVGVFSTTQKKIVTDATQVTFGKISEDEIDYYLEHYKPYDKAGSYGVQEWIGYIGVKQMVGSYFTVMGLPVYHLYQVLKDW